MATFKGERLQFGNAVQKRREPPKVPCKMEMEVDKISNLPGHITDKILAHLSLRDAVRTSVLSKKWRYKWDSLPYLVFDNQSVLVSSPDQTVIKSTLVNIVDHVLLLHSGPIEKFKLSHRDLQGSLKEFVLEIWKGHRYRLPSSLYCCQNLIDLELFNCLSLDLQHITVDQDVFEYLISSCLVLERLTLMNFEGFTQLNIHAPNLLFFDVGGVFEDVNFGNASHLAIVSIGLYVNAGYEKNPALGNTGNMIKFFAPLPHIQRLEVQSFFLKYLAAGKVPERLPTPCIELNYLSIRINFNDREESLAALCLLRSSPNLQELEMLARPEEQTAVRPAANILEEGSDKCPFNQLRLVKIAGISGGSRELNFINFLLANSPALEMMTVKPASTNGGWELLKELLRFRRASVQVEIIYLDP
ncbi:hypothetical protein RJ639_029609 [Escallonia herrerae]|uniref:F-box domain-containing protein n=1 Tax=Escallonia herrerae TaxID=1293975 RepID=A0AA88X9S1_9ASTE|nr:hypothetical protein RJ639_029609 [Escallonia herrerae]